ncbi:MAG: prohibitin family protein [Acidobacteria bacterium]|nr:prohibitin family protein [Acidobacteriota bacterium]
MESDRFFHSTKSIKIVVIVSSLLILLVALSSTIILINPGHVGVLIKRSGGGISPQPLGVGFHLKAPIFQEIEEYPIYMQTLVLTKDLAEGSPRNEEINVNSVEGQPISCDVSLSFELDPNQVPHLYSVFRTDIDTITHGFIKQTIRQSLQENVGKTEIVNFLGKEKAQIVSQVQNDLQKRLSEYGFVVKQFTLNEVRAPQSIVKAIEAKNTMAQDALRAQNELQKKEFEAQQKVIEAEGDAKSIFARAEAQAKSNHLIAESITPTLVEYKKIEKWDGKMPQVAGTNAATLLNLQENK